MIPLSFFCRISYLYLALLLIVHVLVHVTQQAKSCVSQTDRRSNITTQLGGVLDLKPVQSQQCNSTCFPYRNDLQCGSCQSATYSKKRKECCACAAKPAWIGKEKNMSLEFTSRSGKSIVLNYGADNHSAIYQITHTYGQMSDIPSNICNWDKDNRTQQIYMTVSKTFDSLWTRIVQLNFSHNNIKKVVDLNCLENLDSLDLSYNRIKNLQKSSILKLFRLRELFLQHNQIDHVEANIFMDLNVLSVDLSNNFLKEIDVTNMLPYYPFCKIDYSQNKIETLTNKCGFEVDGTHEFGPGFVSFNGNSFRKFPDLKELLHMEDFSVLAKFISCGFDFRNIPLDCDCVFEPLLELAHDFVESYWLDYMNITCNTPVHLHNIPVVNISLEDFKCNMTDDPACPIHCNCIDQPHARTLFIDCYNKGKTDVPHRVPISSYSPYVSLNMSRNFITTIRNESYFENVTFLDVSENDLKQITNHAAKKLENAAMLNISGNSRLVSLPQDLQYQNMCRFDMNGLIMHCDCETLWMANWVSLKECPQNQSHAFKCLIPGHGILPANEFTSDLLDCFPKDNWKTVLSINLAILSTLLLILGFLTYSYRYEILVLYLRARRTDRNKISPEFKYDAYVSLDDDDDKVSNWVTMVLLPYLEEKGYKVFVHYRDMELGDVRTLATIDVMATTRNFIPILSDGYLKCNNVSTILTTENEWKYGWQMFKTDRRKNLVLINFDHISSFEEKNPKMKALIRVGGQVEFSNTKGDIMELITGKLGPPCSMQTRTDTSESKEMTQTSFMAFQAESVKNQQQTTSDKYQIGPDRNETEGEENDKGENMMESNVTESNESEVTASERQ